MRGRIAIALVGALLCGAGNAARADDGLDPVVQLLAEIDEPAVQLDLLNGLRDALAGKSSAPLPGGWSTAYAKLSRSPDPRVRSDARALAILFGDPVVLAELQRTAGDAKSPAPERLAAVEALVARRPPELAPLLHRVVQEPQSDAALRSAALRGLAAVPHAETPRIVLARYGTLSADEKREAVALLSSRKDFAGELLEAIGAKRVPATDVSSFAARQIHALGDERLAMRLRETWGEVRSSSAERLATIAKYKGQLGPNVLKQADLSKGRLLWAKTCRACHVLHGDGGKIGPELTGSNRANLDYLLANVVDPSSEIGQAYRMWTVVTTSGRVLTGLIVEQDAARTTVQTTNERLVVPTAEIEAVKPSPLSMMPEGQLDKLTPEEVRDLVAYLASREQVPYPPGTPAP
jgi:putative heme-binding domain-containing protein